MEQVKHKVNEVIEKNDRGGYSPRRCRYAW